MSLRFISPTLHGIIDYSAAMALIVAPFVLRLGESSMLAIWLSVATGLIVILVSTNTIYKYGIFHTLSFNVHLAIDLVAATIFAVAPFILGFEGMDLYYYIANAVVVYLVVALSNNCNSILNQQS